MIAYASSGLVVFALTFLDTRRHFPRVHRTVFGLILVGMAFLAVLITMDWQAWALLLAFGFGGLFAVTMVVLGMIPFTDWAYRAVKIGILLDARYWRWL